MKGVSAMDSMTDAILSLTVCGLLYDAAGVSLLGFAFFAKTKNRVIEEAGTYWDSNPHVLRGIVASKFDGVAGTLLLLVGFLLQILGYLQIRVPLVAVVLYILLAVTIVAYAAFLRASLVKKWLIDLQALEHEKR